jgi:xanthine dehydrogenase accessory factor
MGGLVDGRMRKQPPEADLPSAQLVIGLGPGFIAGENCDAVIETQRGPNLGRVIWQGSPQVDTGVPEGMAPYDQTRVLRAPADGILETLHEIGDQLKAGQPVARVAGKEVLAPFDGMLRGLLHPGLTVQRGLKIGDVDPRFDPLLCTRVSDKALAVAGGVLEAILSRPTLRPHLWE